MYVVITGTSRGIGLELLRQGLESGHHILGIARRPEESLELQKLKKNYSTHCELLALDLLQDGAELKISEAIRNWPRVDVLINNAGIYEEDNSIKDFEKTFLTNTIKPFFLTRALFEKFKISERPLSLQITSQMGSLGDNHSGGSYSYRASKAALNMLYKSLSIDEKWLISLQVHPGWVQTRMGGNGAPLAPQDSANGIWKLVEKASLSQSGTFVTYRGEKVQW